MKKSFTSLILGVVAALLIVSGACKTPGVSELPVGVEQPPISALQRIENAQESFRQGLIYYRQERWPEAIAEFRRAAEINPSEGIYYWYLGECYEKQENYDAGTASYTKAIELYPSSKLMEQWHLPMAYLKRGNCHYDKGKITLAIQDITKAIEVNPRDDKEMASALYCYRGLYHRALGLRDQAIADYKTVVQLGDPEWTRKAQEALKEIGGFQPPPAIQPSHRTYVAPDYAYQFRYPGDWKNVSDELSYAFEATTPNIPDVQPDAVLGKFQDKFHAIYIACMRWPCPFSTKIDECVDLYQLEQAGFTLGRAQIGGKEAIVGSFDNPSNYWRAKVVYVWSDKKIFYFCLEAMGKSYYDLVDDTYSIFIGDLQVK